LRRDDETELLVTEEYSSRLYYWNQWKYT
jgi:hypothetical protein